MAKEGNGIIGVSEVGVCIFGEARAHVLGKVTGAVDIALICATGSHLGRFEVLYEDRRDCSYEDDDAPEWVR